MGGLTPAWLADLLAGTMLATSAYCGTRIVYARVSHRATHHDVDGLHVLMGVAMAGMLTRHFGALSPTRGVLHEVWIVVFAVGATWFAYQAVRNWRNSAGQANAGHAGSGPVVHLIGAAAMLYMLADTSGGGMAGMGASGGTAAFPEAGMVLAVLAAGAAVVIVDRLAPATADASANRTPDAVSAEAARRFIAPRVAECCHLAMCVTTAYMLIAMFA